ncbi:heme-binding protein [Herbiconiux sp. CPCC 205716]|uniref:Heme-binding protein n=1 Tax=Herbiconiux gentiana TaxID=2970912 RepID=A0ABT2GAC9_9MICO|nr:heme-binding protein [Herbiconiux gentiana]MCS5713155.1 heme-binding protein [Herbiconiux gentiana]
MSLTTEEAEQILAACAAAAREHGYEVGIAVADEHGDALVARRSEEKTGLTLRLSLAKAYTAAIMRKPSRTLDDWQQTRPIVLSALSQLGQYPIVPGDGGMPILREGKVIGGVGMSGAPELEDTIIQGVLRTLGFDDISA